MSSSIDVAVRQAAGEFVEAVFATAWRGREREAVSLFALGYLIRQCHPSSILTSPTQIAIEAAVPGVPELNPKGRVNKDLVIWHEPAQTCWDSDWHVAHAPLAVMEWKVSRPATKAGGLSQYDLAWLKASSQIHRHFIGYAVALDLAGRRERMRIGRVSEGASDLEWLVL